MPGQRQGQLVRRNTATIVAHPDQLGAARLDIHVDAGRAGIQRILHQFFHHRGGPLNHLAGGDLVDQCIR